MICVELKETVSTKGVRRYFIDGVRVSRDRMDEVKAAAYRLDTFLTVGGKVTRHYCQARLR